jgi:hypothetical protein
LARQTSQGLADDKARKMELEENFIDKLLLVKLKDNPQALKEYALRKLKNRQSMYMTMNDRLHFGDSNKSKGTLNMFDNEILKADNSCGNPNRKRCNTDHGQ